MSEPAPRGYMAPSAKDDWRTPPHILDLVTACWGATILLDPCASPEEGSRFAKHNVWPGSPGFDQDGLAVTWMDRTFVNPPFQHLHRWVIKAEAEAENCGDTVGLVRRVCLLTPSRTDTKFWQKHLLVSCSAILLLKGRLTFVGAPAPAPFPTALCFWNTEAKRIAKVAGDLGRVVVP